MFCENEEGCCEIPGKEKFHWCPECKFGACEWCCGCPECHEMKKGGWSPPDVQINHDGIRERAYRESQAGGTGEAPVPELRGRKFLGKNVLRR